MQFYNILGPMFRNTNFCVCSSFFSFHALHCLEVQYSAIQYSVEVCHFLTFQALAGAGAVGPLGALLLYNSMTKLLTLTVENIFRWLVALPPSIFEGLLLDGDGTRLLKSLLTYLLLCRCSGTAWCSCVYTPGLGPS